MLISIQCHVSPNHKVLWPQKISFRDITCATGAKKSEVVIWSYQLIVHANIRSLFSHHRHQHGRRLWLLAIYYQASVGVLWIEKPGCRYFYLSYNNMPSDHSAGACMYIPQNLLRRSLGTAALRKFWIVHGIESDNSNLVFTFFLGYNRLVSAT